MGTNKFNFSIITLHAASLMNCLAAGLQMAGTVMTHRMSFSLYFSSPVLSRIISIARSLRYLNEWAKTTKASIFFPFRAVSFVFLSNVCNRRRQIYKDCLILLMRINFSGELIQNPKRCVLSSLVLRTLRDPFSFSCNYHLI